MLGMLSLLFSTIAFAQDADIEFGAITKEKGSQVILANNDDGLFTLRFRKKKVFIEFYDSEDMARQFTTPINFKDPNDNRQLYFKYGYLYNNQLVLLASYYDKSEDKNILFCSKYNTEGEVQEDWKEVASFEATRSKNAGGYGIRYSPDKKRLLVYADLPYSKKENERYILFCFDASMSLQWKKEIELDIQDKNTALDDYYIDNLGNVHLLAHSTPASRKERKQAKKAKEDVKSHYVFTYDFQNDKLISQEIRLENKTVIFTGIRIDTSNNVYVAGFYQDNLKKKARLSGVFYARMKSGSNELDALSTREFSKDFIKKIIGEKSAKKGREINTTFQLRNVLTTQDGGIALVAEEYYVTQHCTTDPKTGARRCTNYYHYDDIIIVNLNSEGDITWANIIHKGTVTSGTTTYLSVSSFFENGKIHLVYNQSLSDHYGYNKKENYKHLKRKQRRSRLSIVATIDKDGNMAFSDLYNHSEAKFYLRSRHLSRVGNGTLLGIADGRKNKYKIARIRL